MAWVLDFNDNTRIYILLRLFRRTNAFSSLNLPDQEMYYLHNHSSAVIEGQLGKIPGQSVDRGEWFFRAELYWYTCFFTISSQRRLYLNGMHVQLIKELLET